MTQTPPAPRPRRRWWVYLFRVGFFSALTYVALMLLLLALEGRLLYPAFAAQGRIPAPATLGQKDLELTAADGTRIDAWWCVPEGWTPEHGAILWCHGNGENITLRGRDADMWVHQHKRAVVMFDYPGYGNSGGSPSEAGCCAAADAAYNWLVKEQKVPGDRVVIYGQSLGGGVAVDLASRKPHRALVLVSTFTSFPDLAQQKFPIFPARWLVSNQYRSRDRLAALHTPVFIVHGTADPTIPFSHGEALYAAAGGPKVFHPVAGAGHNDTAGHFERELAAWLNALPDSK